MKHTKLLKSAVLSTALLWGGATHAQSTTGSMSVAIVGGQTLTITAGALSFGTQTSTSAIQNLTLGCTAGAEAVTGGDNQTAEGSCGDVAVNVSSGTANFTIAVASAALARTGQTSIPAPTLTIYNADGTTATTGTQSVTNGTAKNYVIGGTLAIPARQAAGTYSAQYTVTARIT